MHFISSVHQFLFIFFPFNSIYFTGDLLYYGGVEWLNISDFLGKIKKGLELHAMCFVFKTAVVFLCKERLRQKKKIMVNITIFYFVFCNSLGCYMCIYVIVYVFMLFKAIIMPYENM